MGKALNYAIPRGTTRAGVMAEPSVYHDDRPFGLRPWWAPRSGDERAADERWRSAYAATLRTEDRTRPPGNVVEW